MNSKAWRISICVYQGSRIRGRLDSTLDSRLPTGQSLSFSGRDGARVPFIWPHEYLKPLLVAYQDFY